MPNYSPSPYELPTHCYSLNLHLESGDFIQNCLNACNERIPTSFGQVHTSSSEIAVVLEVGPRRPGWFLERELIGSRGPRLAIRICVCNLEQQNDKKTVCLCENAVSKQLWSRRKAASYFDEDVSESYCNESALLPIQLGRGLPFSTREATCTLMLLKAPLKKVSALKR
eukprot:5119905-Amphidinium_carterae.1